MQDLKENQNRKMQEEDTPMMKLQQENQQLLNLIARYQTTEILQNQRAFNEWMMTEMLKLKEAVNQIGEGLSLILSEAESEESETEDSEEESDSEEQEEEKEIEVPKPIPEPEVKKKAGRPKSF